MLRQARLSLVAAIICVSAVTLSLDAQANGKLYSYANPLPSVLKKADHTWVSDYDRRPKCPYPDSAYWYATGGCHPSASDKDPRPLSSAPADLNVARCIATPDRSTFNPGPFTARIVYGLDGVCHQICNRVLAATGIAGATPITVGGAHGYRVSRFFYGTYGTPAQWRRLRDECKAKDSIGTLDRSAEVEVMASEVNLALSPEKLTALKSEQAAYVEQLNTLYQRMAESDNDGRAFAREANSAANASLHRLEGVLGKDAFEQYFDWPLGQEIELIDPEVAALVQYTK
jgi:hypothetical protein